MWYAAASIEVLQAQQELQPGQVKNSLKVSNRETTVNEYFLDWKLCRRGMQQQAWKCYGLDRSYSLIGH